LDQQCRSSIDSLIPYPRCEKMLRKQSRRQYAPNLFNPLPANRNAHLHRTFIFMATITALEMILDQIIILPIPFILEVLV
jgi:hypothetical protein